jgi:hypothetical protein
MLFLRKILSLEFGFGLLSRVEDECALYRTRCFLISGTGYNRHIKHDLCGV